MSSGQIKSNQSCLSDEYSSSRLVKKIKINWKIRACITQTAFSEWVEYQSLLEANVSPSVRQLKLFQDHVKHESTLAFLHQNVMTTFRSRYMLTFENRYFSSLSKIMQKTSKRFFFGLLGSSGATIFIWGAGRGADLAKEANGNSKMEKPLQMIVSKISISNHSIVIVLNIKILKFS